MALPAIISTNLTPLGLPAAPAGTAALAGGATPAARSLAFSMEAQQQSNWCWSAVSLSVAKFYGAATLWSRQCDVASAELSKVCCPPGGNPACDVPWYLDSALTRVSHYNTMASGPATLSQIRAEIDTNRPPCFRVGWNSGGGHFVVVSGYSSSSAGTTVTIDDPIYGHSTLDLATVQSAYQGTGSWTHTYWTAP